MTAINALSMGDAAYLMTDTAIYEADGFVRGFATKVRTLPQLRMAFATSGPHEQGPRVQAAFDLFSSFDEVVERLPQRLRDMAEDGEFECMGGADHFRLVMIGWSERLGCAQACALSTEREPELEPFALGIAPVAINPSVHFDVLRDAGLLVGEQPIGDNPEQWLIKLIDIQRTRKSGERGTVSQYVEPEDGHYLVGGHAVLTKVGKHGITQRVVRRWPDRLNDYINPTRAKEYGNDRGYSNANRHFSTGPLRRQPTHRAPPRQIAATTVCNIERQFGDDELAFGRFQCGVRIAVAVD